MHARGRGRRRGQEGRGVGVEEATRPLVGEHSLSRRWMMTTIKWLWQRETGRAVNRDNGGSDILARIRNRIIKG